MAGDRQLTWLLGYDVDEPGWAGNDAKHGPALKCAVHTVGGQREGAELVVESIAEDLAAKVELLGRAERLALPDAVLATNTSSLSIASIAAGLERPERFAGLHWFNPPELVPLVEVVAGERTDAGVVEALRDWMEALGKAPIVLRKDIPGFVANRLQYGLVREAWTLVEDGVCSYEDVDRALTHGLGARWAAVGPFQIADLAGLDVYLAVIRNLYPDLSTDQAPAPTLVEAVESGAHGVKTGRGLLGEYDAADAARIAEARNAMLRAIEAARAARSGASSSLSQWRRGMARS